MGNHNSPNLVHSTSGAAPVAPGDMHIQQAMKSDDWAMFRKAALAELESVELNNVWIEAIIPFDDYGEGPIPLMWLFKRKYDENGAFIKFEARLVVLGNYTVYGLDYFDTFVTLRPKVILNRTIDTNRLCYLTCKNGVFASNMRQE
jgi:hypothetical protein